MNKHLIDTHLNFLGTHKCLECDHIAENKHQLKRHVRWEHHGGKREACPRCTFVATKTQKLWPHWRTHHPNDEVLHCDMCGYITPLEYLMEVSQKLILHISKDITLLSSPGYTYHQIYRMYLIFFFSETQNQHSLEDKDCMSNLRFRD